MGFVAHGVSTILRHLTECTTTSLERVHISWPKIVTQQSPGIPYGWDTFTAPFSMKLSYRPLSHSALNSHTESLFTLVWHFTFSEIINSVVIPCPFTYFDKHCFVQRKDSYKQMYGVILKAFFFFFTDHFFICPQIASVFFDLTFCLCFSEWQVHNSRSCSGSVYSCPRSLSLFFPNEEEIHIRGYRVLKGEQRLA